MKLGRIGYINCYPVYGAIDRGEIKVSAELVTGTPAELKARFGTVLFHLDFGRQEAARAADTALAAAGYRPQRDGAGLQVRSTSGSGELPGMLRALGGRAPDPVSVAVREPTLDDVFLSLTGGGEAA